MGSILNPSIFRVQQQRQLIGSPVVCAGHWGVVARKFNVARFRSPGSIMDHHGPTVRLSMMILRLVAHLFVAALLTVESSSSFSSAMLLIPADSQRQAPISSRSPSSEEAVAIDTSDDECKSLSCPSARLLQPFVAFSRCSAAAAE